MTNLYKNKSISQEHGSKQGKCVKDSQKNMLKIFKMAIKKLTDNPRKNTCIIFNVHSKKKHIFVQKKCTIK